MSANIRITWDAAPIRQQFGEGLLVADGVAILPNGTEYRVNASANRHGKRADVMLRYLTAAKRGHAVPETVCTAVRDAARLAAADLFAAMIAEERAASRPADERADLDNMAGTPEAPAVATTIKLRGFVTPAVVEATRERMAAEDAAAAGPEMIGNTARACYWRTPSGFVATASATIKPTDNGGAYSRLDALMKLKGEDAATIDRVLRNEVLRLNTPKPVEVIEMTPTWGAILPVLLAAMEHGTDKGRDSARVELTRMAELADERNIFAKRLEGVRADVEAFHAVKGIRAWAADENVALRNNALATLRGEND